MKKSRKNILAEGNNRYFRKIQDISSQFDGEKTEFNLFWSDGSIVKSEPFEEIVIDVPEFWDRETVEFHYNEGSWCSSIMDIWLTRMEKHKGCLCHFAEFTYLREATEDDEEYHGLFIKNLPT